MNSSSDGFMTTIETEKFGREAFAKIKATFASNLDENDIILDWCFASVHTMLQVMTIS